MSAEIIAAMGLSLVLVLVVLVLGMLNRKSVAFREEAASQSFSAPLGGFFEDEQGVADRSQAGLRSESSGTAWSGQGAGAGEGESGSRFSELRPRWWGGENGSTETGTGERTAYGVPPAPAITLSVSGNGGSPAGAVAVASAAAAYNVVAASGADPVAALVASLIEGQGELSQAELRRLELFRPDRVLDAVADLNERLTGRGKERERSRLQKIRLHAETLRSAEESDEPVAASWQSEEEPDATRDSTPTEAWPAAQPHKSEAWQSAPAEPAHAWPASPSGLPDAWPEAPADASEVWPVAPADPANAWPTAQEESEVAHQAGTEYELWETWVPEDATASAWSPEESAPPGPASALPTEEMPLHLDEPEVQLVAQPELYEDATSTLPAPARGAALEDQLSALDINIESAEDVLALPSRERRDAAAFLGAPELARLLTMADDLDLCRAAVDQLERIATPESLSAINSVLEEGDLALQLYAVNAAERLLARM